VRSVASTASVFRVELCRIGLYIGFGPAHAGRVRFGAQLLSSRDGEQEMCQNVVTTVTVCFPYWSVPSSVGPRSVCA
jgi:hypothetical protein